MRLAISRLGHVIEFGTLETTPTKTLAGSKVTFRPTQRLHCAYYQRTQSQQYRLLGTELEGTTVVAVRSQYHVDQALKARLNGELYTIVAISRDESHTIARYDLITLKRIQKVGV